MLKTTALHARHQTLGAKLVDFAGWEMPVQYKSALDEHRAVRTTCGMFDVGHMQVVDVSGAHATAFLQYVLANNVAKLKTPGQALYTCMLLSEGGVIDDLIVTRRAEDAYRIVVNAGTADSDIAWLKKQAVDFDVDVVQREELGILAVQGPQARESVAEHLPGDLRKAALALKPFTAAWDEDWYLSRTGYTGEDGFEIIAKHDRLVALWDSLIEDGVVACGLGARDSLRLEAGLNLYGNDMDESVSPLECALGWTIAWEPVERDFIGRKALEKQREVPERLMRAVVLDGRGVLRAHMPVRDAAQREVGTVTSGGFAPTMKTAIGFIRLARDAQPPFEVEIRGRWLPLRVVKAPFVRNGRVLV